MRLMTFIAMLGLLVMVSCKDSAKKTDAAAEATEAVQDVFGEDFDASKESSFAEVVRKANDGEVEAVLSGKVDAVCQVKGCWMTITNTDVPTDTMFVKFHDYGFFMPLDLSGSEVVMKGKAFVEETSVEELRHYAEDEGLSKEEIMKITEPEKELKFLATGVKLKK